MRSSGTPFMKFGLVSRGMAGKIHRSSRYGKGIFGGEGGDWL